MKSIFSTRMIVLLFGIFVMASCKNPNATQETDGVKQDGPTAAEIDSSSIERPGDTLPTSVPKDLEGKNTSNN
ncbi:hypothetical protein [Flavobacterium noncentrifugens]|uniref:Uncharacterized protein n=1 Tax=Flavobacterium noncentrifugens TaxID=1128970 RepID=A0A1G8XUY5_9FLAO|nr:hypothetical protein [Flavobacterium noncentrifugens]SDJ93590.1 hypothetical protein SAMN04487935_2050 [Flavobacterium noncentrifugens]